MKRISLILLALCCQITFMMATEVTVSGTIFFAEDSQPIPGYEVSLMLLDLVPDAHTAATNEDGVFEFVLDLDFAANPVHQAIIEYFDMCTGEVHAIDIPITEDENIDLTFIVCAGINPPPPPAGCEAFFAWEQTSSDPYEMQFHDLSYNSLDVAPDSWHWDFGDGSTPGSVQNPVHTYAEEGDYEVTLTIVADTCTSTIVMPVHVIDFDFCNCEWIYDPICVVLPDGEIIPFINECEAICAGFEYAEMTDCEGDGPCGCPEIFFPVCVLTEAGDTLNFDNPCLAECEGYGEDSYIDCGGDGPCGCDLEFDPVCVVTEEGIIEFFPNPCTAECAGYGPDTYTDCEGFNCFAAFDYYVLDDGFTVEFMDVSGTFSAPAVEWSWDMGDGTTYNEPHVIHTYAEEGNYIVTLTIVTEDGCTSTYSQNICIGEDCIGNCDCDDEFDPVCVLTDEGVIITLPNPCFALCLGFPEDTWVECEDDCECDDIFDPVCVLTQWGDIEWFVNACEAECAGYGEEDFTECDGACPCPDYYDPVCVVTEAGDTLQFDNPCFAECDGYGPDQYFPCGIIDPCGCYEIFDPVCVELPDGTTILFANDCFAMCEGYTEADFVECEGWGFDDCVASFYYEFNEIGEAHFIDASYALEGTIVSWEWDFGDGNTSTEQNPVHQYAEGGIYDITLTITTDEGCVSTMVEHICIADGGIFDGPDCQAMFFFEQSTDIPYTFQFTDFSWGEADSWSWDFGDGNSSTEQNPVHTYQEEGVYLVTLTITAGDCQSSMPMLVFTDDNIWYPNECMALFLPLIDPNANEVFFLNLSSPDAVSYAWDFGDGTTSTDPVATHTYAEDGTYEVTLTITTADGCENTYSVSLNMESNGFTGNPTYLLLNDTEAELPSLNRINVFPNPATSILNVDMEVAKAGEYQLQLIGLDGKIHQLQAHELAIGKHNIPLSVSNLASGMYLLRIQSTNGVQSLKVVIQ